MKNKFVLSSIIALFMTAVPHWNAFAEDCSEKVTAIAPFPISGTPVCDIVASVNNNITPQQAINIASDVNGDGVISVCIDTSQRGGINIQRSGLRIYGLRKGLRNPLLSKILVNNVKDIWISDIDASVLSVEKAGTIKSLRGFSGRIRLQANDARIESVRYGSDMSVYVQAGYIGSIIDSKLSTIELAQAGTLANLSNVIVEGNVSIQGFLGNVDGVSFDRIFQLDTAGSAYSIRNVRIGFGRISGYLASLECSSIGSLNIDGRVDYISDFRTNSTLEISPAGSVGTLANSAIGTIYGKPFDSDLVFGHGIDLKGKIDYVRGLSVVSRSSPLSMTNASIKSLSQFTFQTVSAGPPITMSGSSTISSISDGILHKLDRHIPWIRVNNQAIWSPAEYTFGLIKNVQFLGR